MISTISPKNFKGKIWGQVFNFDIKIVLSNYSKGSRIRGAKWSSEIK
jgi:hypothetical protein